MFKPSSPYRYWKRLNIENEEESFNQKFESSESSESNYICISILNIPYLGSEHVGAIYKPQCTTWYKGLP